LFFLILIDLIALVCFFGLGGSSQFREIWLAESGETWLALNALFFCFYAVCLAVVLFLVSIAEIITTIAAQIAMQANSIAIPIVAIS
jgi:hypothetical protein